MPTGLGQGTGKRRVASTPLTGRYLVRRRSVAFAMRARDAWLRLTVPRRAAELVAPPRRILLAIGGHAGDAVIASALLPVLREAWPGVEIGVAAGSWFLPLLRGHPAISWYHAVDHWKANRGPNSLASKWRQHARSARSASEQMRRVGYDAAVDVYPFYPNMARVIWRAGIPVRVGYASGGSGPLLTHAAEWLDTEGHTAAQHVELLRRWLPHTEFATPAHYDLPSLAPDEEQLGRSLLGRAGVIAGRYAVLHPGTGNPIKSWPETHWIALARSLAAVGLRPVFTGHGPREGLLIERLMRSVPDAVSLHGLTTWATLRYVLRHAVAAVGCDSVAMHLAAAEGTRCVALMTGTSDPRHWHPLGVRAAWLMNSVPCSPCYLARGCGGMECVREISPAAVQRAIGF